MGLCGCRTCVRGSASSNATVNSKSKAKGTSTVLGVPFRALHTKVDLRKGQLRIELLQGNLGQPSISLLKVQLGQQSMKGHLGQRSMKGHLGQRSISLLKGHLGHQSIELKKGQLSIFNR